MGWVPILEVAVDGVAIASTCIATLFGYRAVSHAVGETSPEADLQRQSVCATYAVVAGGMAAAAFALKLLGI
jgi:hypothetical protein